MAASGKLYQKMADGSLKAICYGGGGGSGTGTSFDTNFHATLSVNQAVVAGANRKILFDTVAFDGNSEWDAINLYWLCKTDGYYGIMLSAAPINTYINYFRSILYIDGVAVVVGQNITGTSGTTTASLIYVPNIYIAASSYVEAYCSMDVDTSVAANVTATNFRIVRYK